MYCWCWRTDGIRGAILPEIVTTALLCGMRLCGALAFRAQFVHPSLNRDFLSDTAWTFSIYLESLAIVPQLYMFQKQAKGIVEVLVSEECLRRCRRHGWGHCFASPSF